MDRREATRRVLVLMGTAISAPLLSGLLQSCSSNSVTIQGTEASLLVTEKQQAMIAEVAETIIPTTDTPGAIEAKVPEFILLMLADCYPQADQERFFKGLDQLNESALKAYDLNFLECNPDQKLALVIKEESIARAFTEKQQKAQEEAKRDGKALETALPFFTIIKELTLVGYFTSEIGATQALAYVPVPGHFNGSEPLQPGQKAWAV